MGCVRVKQWCGKGTKTHPCVVNVKIPPQKSKLAPPRRHVKSAMQTQVNRTQEDLSTSLGGVVLMQLPVPVDTVDAMKQAAARVMWPKRHFCFHRQQQKHCVSVKSW